MVQCGSCGNKWKQFPVKETKEIQPISRPQKVVSIPKPVKQKIQKPKSSYSKNRGNQFVLTRVFSKKAWYSINESQSVKIVKKKSESFFWVLQLINLFIFYYFYL